MTTPTNNDDPPKVTITKDEEGLLTFTNFSPADLTFHTIITSPFAQKVHTYLLYKQIPFTIKYVHPKQLVKHVVPTFVLKNGTYLTESSALGIWLEDNFPESPMMIPSHIRQQQIDLEARLSHLLIPPLFQSVSPHVCSRGGLGTKITSLCRQIGNAWRMGGNVNATVPGGIGILRYIWPVIMRTSKFIKVILNDLDQETDGAPASQNISNALDTLEHELQAAEDEFYNANAVVADQEDYVQEEAAAPTEATPLQQQRRRHRRDGNVDGGEGDIVFLSRSISHPGIADLTAYAAVTTGYRLGLAGVDGFRNRPAIMWWVRKLDTIMEKKQRQGVVLKDSEAGTEVSYFAPPLIPTTLQRNQM